MRYQRLYILIRQKGWRLFPAHRRNQRAWIAYGPSVETPIFFSIAGVREWLATL